jgi:hypothetical protein
MHEARCQSILLQDKLRNNIRNPLLLAGIYVVAALLVTGIVAFSLDVGLSSEIELSFAVKPPMQVHLGQIWPFFSVQVQNSNGLPVAGALVDLFIAPLGDIELPVVAANEVVAEAIVRCVSDSFSHQSAASTVHRNLCSPASTGAFTPSSSVSNDIGTAKFLNAQLTQGVSGAYVLIARCISQTDSRGTLVATVTTFVTVLSPVLNATVSSALPIQIALGESQLFATFNAALDPRTFVSAEQIWELSLESAFNFSTRWVPVQMAELSADWLLLDAAAETNSYAGLFPTVSSPLQPPTGKFLLRSVNVSAMLTVDAPPFNPSKASVSLSLQTTWAASLTASNAANVFIGVSVWGQVFALTPSATLSSPGMIPSTVIPPISFQQSRAFFINSVSDVSVTEGSPFTIHLEGANECFISAVPTGSQKDAAVTPKEVLSVTTADDNTLSSQFSIYGAVGLYNVSVVCAGQVVPWHGEDFISVAVTSSMSRGEVHDDAPNSTVSVGDAWSSPPRVLVFGPAGPLPGKFASISSNTSGVQLTFKSRMSDGSGWITFDYVNVAYWSESVSTATFVVTIDNQVVGTITRWLAVGNYSQTACAYVDLITQDGILYATATTANGIAAVNVAVRITAPPVSSRTITLLTNASGLVEISSPPPRVTVPTVVTVRAACQDALQWQGILVTVITPRATAAAQSGAIPRQPGNITLSLTVDWQRVNSAQPLPIEAAVVWSPGLTTWFYPPSAVHRTISLLNITTWHDLQNNKTISVVVDASVLGSVLQPGAHAVQLLMDGAPIQGTLTLIPPPHALQSLQIQNSALTGFSATTKLVGNTTVEVVSNMTFSSPTNAPRISVQDASGGAYQGQIILVAQLGTSSSVVDPTNDNENIIQWLNPIERNEDIIIGALSGGTDASPSSLLAPVSATSTANGLAFFPTLVISGANTSYYFYIRYCFNIAEDKAYGSTICVPEARAIAFARELQPVISVGNGTSQQILLAPGAPMPPIAVVVGPNGPSASETRFVVCAAPVSSGFVQYGVHVFSGTQTVLEGIFGFTSLAPSGAVPVSIIVPGCSTTVWVVISNVPDSITVTPLPPSVKVGRPVPLTINVNSAGFHNTAELTPLANQLLSISVERVGDYAEGCRFDECGVLDPSSTTFGTTGHTRSMLASLTFAAAATGNYTVSIAVVSAITQDGVHQLLQTAVTRASADVGLPFDLFADQENSAGSYADQALIIAAQSTPLYAAVNHSQKSVKAPAENSLLRRVKALLTELKATLRSSTAAGTSTPVTLIIGPLEVVNPVLTVAVTQPSQSKTFEQLGSSRLTNLALVLDPSTAPMAMFGVAGVATTVRVIDVKTGKEADDVQLGFSFRAYNWWLETGAWSWDDEMLDTLNTTFPTTDKSGRVTYVGLVLRVQRSGVYQLHFSSRGSPGALGPPLTIHVYRVGIFEGLKLFAYVFSIVFLPLFAANVPHAHGGIVALAVVVSLVGSSVMLYEANKHWSSIHRNPLMITYCVLTLLAAAYVMCGFMYIGIAVLSRARRSGRVSRKRRRRWYTTCMLDVSSVEGENRAHDVFEYAKWITNVRIDRLSIPVAAPSCFKRLRRSLRNVFNLEADDLKAHKLRAQREREIAAQLQHDHLQSVEEPARSETQESSGHMSMSRDVVRVTPRPDLKRPKDIPSAAFIPVNIVIVISFAVVIAIVASLFAWWLYFQIRAYVIQFILYLPDPEQLSSTDVEAASYALTEGIETVVGVVSASFPQLDFLAAAAQQLNGANIIGWLADFRHFLVALIHYILAAFIAGTVVANLTVVATFAATLWSVPRLIVRLRRGDLKDLRAFRNPNIAALELYVGQHIMHTMFVFVIVFVLVGTITLIIAIPLLREFLYYHLRYVVLIAVVSIIISQLLRQLVARFLADGWLVVRPGLYAVYSFLDLLLGIFGAVTAPFVRWGEAVAFVTLCFAKLDESVIPRPFDILDAGTTAFRGTVAAEARYGNPIMLSFASLLVLDVEVKHAVAVKLAAREARRAERKSAETTIYPEHADAIDDAVDNETSMTEEGSKAIFPAPPETSEEVPACASEPAGERTAPPRGGPKLTAEEREAERSLDLTADDVHQHLAKLSGKPDGVAPIFICIERFRTRNTLGSARVTALCQIWLRYFHRVNTELATWPYQDCTDPEDNAHDSSDDEALGFTPTTHEPSAMRSHIARETNRSQYFNALTYARQQRRRKVLLRWTLLLLLHANPSLKLHRKQRMPKVTIVAETDQPVA